MRHPESLTLLKSPRWQLAAATVGLAALIAAANLDDRGGERSPSCQPATAARAEAAQPPEKYPLHANIRATVFWAGEPATADNRFIDNVSSAWTRDWVAAYGGIDHPDQRNGFLPAGFTPKENPFYAALPFSDYRDGRPKPESELSVVPWSEGPLTAGQSLLKNRWLAIDCGGATAYAQWQDVGPYEEGDAGYVFGQQPPQSEAAGIDLSPAAADYLGVDGRAEVSWRFVDAADVPDGPWKVIVTTSPPDW